MSSARVRPDRLATLVAALWLWGCAERPPEPPGAAISASIPPAVPAATGLPAPPELHFTAGDLGVGRPLGSCATHTYALPLEAGLFVHVEIVQRGSDVVTRLFDPAGKALLEVDSRSTRRATEHLYHVAAASGTYRLRVHVPCTDRPTGGYLARIAARRPAGERDRRHARAEAAFAHAFAADPAHGELPEAVIERYEAAAGLFGELGLRERRADTFYELGMLHLHAGRLAEAAGYQERSLALYTSPHDRAIGLAELALLHAKLGRPEPAEHGYREALGIFRRLADRRNEAVMLLNLGRLTGYRGRPREALGLLARAGAIFGELDRAGDLADVANLTGEVYGVVGETELALDHHRRAWELLDGRGDPDRRAATLGFMAGARFAAGDLDGAAADLERALALRRDAGSKLGRARLWNGLGLVAERRGDPARALELYGRALAVFAAHHDLLAQAAVLNNLAWLRARLGEPRRALELHRRALELYRLLEHREGEATSLLGIARAERALGSGSALESAAAALERIEQVLGSGQAPPGPDELVLPFFAARQDYFDLYVDLLMDEHLREPDAGYDRLALATAEQSRARHLLAHLADPEPPAAASPDLGEHRRELVATLDAADLRLRRSTLPPEEHEALERRRRLALASYRRLRDEARRRGSWPSGLDTPRTLAVGEIQEILEPGTVLLEIHLGEARSWLWRLRHDGLESHLLPPREEIERRARHAYRMLIESDRIEYRVPARRALEALSETLLGPIAGRLGGERLLVVAGGALQYVPFAALPLPGEPDRRLVEEHEIVHLPSASVVAVLRRQAESRTPPPGLLAVIADPVFGPGDERLGGLAPSRGNERAAFEPLLHRLRHARAEAEAIARLARDHGGRVEVARGFDAQAHLVTSGRLSGYRILHFATHSLLHAEHPELSAVVLSRYGPDGKPRDGRLPLYALDGLDLPADLVVLSACRTALGREVRGEGLLGLPRGFFHAGATRVMVSLWNVQDESTAELMTRFYRHLLDGGLPAAAALAEAQRSMLADPRYAPYHWAPFVLQGDWL